MGKCWEVMAIFHLLRSRRRIDIFSTYKCEVTFGLKYIIISCNIFAKYVLFSFSVILLICSEAPPGGVLAPKLPENNALISPNP